MKKIVSKYDLTRVKNISWWNVINYNNCIIVISEEQNEYLMKEGIEQHKFYKECFLRDIKVEII